ncbi:hypothetical protein C3L33_12049, partial [Rhododendron williamsianum]
ISSWCDCDVLKAIRATAKWPLPMSSYVALIPSDKISCEQGQHRQISEHIEGATIYLDAGCTESFQFLGAFPLLLELGVHAVCSLEDMSPLDMVGDWSPKSDPARKVVVFASRLLSDSHRYVLRCLSTHQNVCNCTIFTSISEVLL